MKFDIGETMGNQDKDETGRTLIQQAEDAVAEFLANGGKIKHIPLGERSIEVDQKAQWGRPRKKSTIPPIKD